MAIRSAIGLEGVGATEGVGGLEAGGGAGAGVAGALPVSSIFTTGSLEGGGWRGTETERMMFWPLRLRTPPAEGVWVVGPVVEEDEGAAAAVGVVEERSAGPSTSSFWRLGLRCECLVGWEDW